MLRKYLQLCTEKTLEVLNIGMMNLANFRLNVFTPDFILLGLLEQKESVALDIIESAGYNTIEVKDYILEQIYKNVSEEQKTLDNTQGQIIVTQELETLFEIALQETKAFEDRYIGTDILFISLFDSRVGKTAKILEDAGLNYAKCRETLKKLRGSRKIDEKDSESRTSALTWKTTSSSLGKKLNLLQ